MTVHLRARSSAVAIYNFDSNSHAPFTDPLGNLSVLLFHSGLRYPHVVRTDTVSVTLPAVAAGAKGDADTTYTATLFAHGRSGIPMVKAKITSGLGTVVGLNGSVPVQKNTGSTNAQTCARWVTIGANATHVILNSYALPFATQAIASITLTLVVYTLSTLVNQPAPAATTSRLHISSSQFRVGEFDTANDYLRANRAGADFPISHGRTLFTSSATALNQACNWRYSTAGFTFESNAGVVSGTTPYTLVTT